MIEIVQACENDKELYRNIFNIYQNELSMYFEDFCYLDDKGYFDYETVDVYFNGDQSIIPYIIRFYSHPIGALVLSTSPYCKADCNYCIQEFFIIGHYRGKGIAEKVISHIFKNNRGKYCLLVLEKNNRAISFWNKTIKKYGTDLITSKNDEGLLIYDFALKNELNT